MLGISNTKAEPFGFSATTMLMIITDCDIDIEPSSPSGKLSRNLLCDVTLFDRHVIPATAEIQGQPASTFVRAWIPAFAGATGNWLEPLPGPALPPSTARARSRRRPRCCSRGGSPLA